MGVPQNHPFLFGIFHEKTNQLLGIPHGLEIPISLTGEPTLFREVSAETEKNVTKPARTIKTREVFQRIYPIIGPI